MARQKGLRMAWGFLDRPSRKMRMKKSHGVPIMTHPWPFFLGEPQGTLPTAAQRTLPTAAQGLTPWDGGGHLHWGGYCDARQKEKGLCRVPLPGARSFLAADHFLAARLPSPVKGPPFPDRACGSLPLAPYARLSLTPAHAQADRCVGLYGWVVACWPHRGHPLGLYDRHGAAPKEDPISGDAILERDFFDPSRRDLLPLFGRRHGRCLDAQDFS